MTSAVLLFSLRVLLALLLYAFLGLILYYLWKDLHRVFSREVSVPEGWLLLSDQEEPIALAAETSIGRAADNMLHLQNETVSAYHARLSHQHGQWILEDVGSKNGTHLNGVLVEGALVLADGDIIEVGSVLLTFALHPSSGKSETEAVAE